MLRFLHRQDQEEDTALREMSWLQVYELSVPHYEIRHGKYVFALQLQRYRGSNNNNQDDSGRGGAGNSCVTAFQSYSQFRTLWKDLQRATKPSSGITTQSALASDGKAAFARRNRQTRQRLRSNPSSHMDGYPSAGVAAATAAAATAASLQPATGSQAPAALSSGACPCSNSCCPFTRLHWLLKCNPFPPKMVLKRNSPAILEARRLALEQFVVSVRDFFTGFPRSFLHSVDSNEHCRVLNLFATFIGFSEELRSMAINRSPLLVAAWKADMLSNRDHRTPTTSSSSYPDNNNASVDQSMVSGASVSCVEHDDDGDSMDDGYEGEEDDAGHLPEYQIPTVYIPSLRTLPEGAATQEVYTYSDLAIRGRGDDVEDDDDATDAEDDDGSVSREYRGSSVYILGIHEPRRTHPSLPKLQIRSAKVKTIGSFLVDFRDHLLGQFGDILNEPTPIAECDDARQWEFGLHLACQIGQLYAVQSILARGTDPNAVTSDGSTALHAACRLGHNKVATCLLDNGADVNAVDKLGMTPLLLSINHGAIALVRLLLDAGADVNLSNARKVSAAHVAVACQSLPILKLLLEYDAFVNTANAINSKTPLHIAAETGNYHMCELLLNNGANVHQRNDRGCDAYALALAQGHVNIAELCRAFQSHSQRLASHRERQQLHQQQQQQQQQNREITPLRQSILRTTMAMAASTTDVCNAHQAVKIVAQDGQSYAIL